MPEYTHEHWMNLAIVEALKGKGRVEPNPMVGCVIVENDQCIAFGHYEADGGPHAEVNALSNLGCPAKENAILYVTLEPCSSQGRTGACTDRIITSGIKHVVIGTIDPNPAHRGRAIGILEKAGVDVVSGILAQECEDLNPEFNERMKIL